MGEARWGICRRCALNRTIDGQGSPAFANHHVQVSMASKKTVAVQFGDFNQVIRFDCSRSDVSEREALLLEIRAAYGEGRIKPAVYAHLSIL